MMGNKKKPHNRGLVFIAKNLPKNKKNIMKKEFEKIVRPHPGITTTILISRPNSKKIEEKNKKQ